MFDFAFSELVLVGVVALVVIGPERLPKVARTVGLLFGRAQRYVAEVKADINNQLRLEELRSIEADLRAKASTAEHLIIEETQRAGQEFKAVADAATVAAPAAAPQGDAEAHVESSAPPRDVDSPPAVESSAPQSSAMPSPQLELGLDAARPDQAGTPSK
ncbi:MAG TPA: Sec-independent protein translocase protein TatB [Sulfuricella sp.]|nr:Sec-independent protein translocase protein TatB [Sulfuricella sp.]